MARSLDHGRAYLLNPALELRWSGWRAYAHDLRRMGWEVSISEHGFDLKMVIAVRGPNGMCHGYGTVDYDEIHHWLRTMGQSGPVAVGLQMAKDIHLPYIDAMKTFSLGVEGPILSDMPGLVRLGTMGIFATFQSPQVLIADESVDELMARILEKQLPRQQEILTESRSRIIRTEAKIITLHAA